MPAQLLQPVETATGPLLRVADLDREIRQMQIRHKRELDTLIEERDLILDAAADLGRTEEAYGWGVYRLVEKPGRRSIDAEKLEQMFPEKAQRLATTKVSYSVAKVEKALSDDDFAHVVVTAKGSRAVKFFENERPVEEAEP